MGQLERRLRRLEEQDERVGFDAALRMASDEDIFLVSGYAERALAADEAGTARPRPTPEEAGAFERLEEHRRRALQQG
jgi:hypothetical protein